MGFTTFLKDNYGTRADLWRFQLSTLEWQWVKGNMSDDVAGIGEVGNPASPLYYPGSRRSGVSAFDSSNEGSLWLFGGLTSSYLCK